MGYLIAYLLLILAVDVICKACRPDTANRKYIVRRRLWNDSNFDCYSTVFLMEKKRNVSQPSPVGLAEFNRKNCDISDLSSCRNSKTLMQYGRGEHQNVLCS